MIQKSQVEPFKTPLIHEKVVRVSPHVGETEKSVNVEKVIEVPVELVAEKVVEESKVSKGEKIHPHTVEQRQRAVGVLEVLSGPVVPVAKAEEFQEPRINYFTHDLIKKEVVEAPEGLALITSTQPPCPVTLKKEDTIGFVHHDREKASNGGDVQRLSSTRLHEDVANGKLECTGGLSKALALAEAFFPESEFSREPFPAPGDLLAATSNFANVVCDPSTLWSNEDVQACCAGASLTAATDGAVTQKDEEKFPGREVGVGGAGYVIVDRGGSCVEEWAGPAGRKRTSYGAERVALTQDTIGFVHHDREKASSGGDVAGEEGGRAFPAEDGTNTAEGQGAGERESSAPNASADAGSGPAAVPGDGSGLGATAVDDAESEVVGGLLQPEEDQPPLAAAGEEKEGGGAVAAAEEEADKNKTQALGQEADERLKHELCDMIGALAFAGGGLAKTPDENGADDVQGVDTHGETMQGPADNKAAAAEGATRARAMSAAERRPAKEGADTADGGPKAEDGGPTGGAGGQLPAEVKKLALSQQRKSQKLPKREKCEGGPVLVGEFSEVVGKEDLAEKVVEDLGTTSKSQFRNLFQNFPGSVVQDTDTSDSRQGGPCGGGSGEGREGGSCGGGSGEGRRLGEGLEWRRCLMGIGTHSSGGLAHTWYRNPSRVAAACSKTSPGG